MNVAVIFLALVIGCVIGMAIGWGAARKAVSDVISDLSNQIVKGYDEAKKKKEAEEAELLRERDAYQQEALRYCIKKMKDSESPKEKQAWKDWEDNLRSRFEATQKTEETE